MWHCRYPISVSSSVDTLSLYLQEVMDQVKVKEYRMASIVLQLLHFMLFLLLFVL